MFAHARFALIWVAAALAGCAPSPAEGTGGTDVKPTAFGRGIFTINENDSYGSTNVSLVGLDGRPLSGSFLSSELSGDVAAPTMPCAGGDVVLVDRQKSIITWVDVRTGQIRAQLHADDEHANDPWDYLPVTADKAYVLRDQPVQTKVDGAAQSGDVIVVDPQSASVTSPVDKRIEIATALGLGADYGAFPARGVVAGGRAYITLWVASTDYVYGSSYIVVLDTKTDTVVASQELTDLHDCTGIALSPSHEELAIACGGDLLADSALNQSHAGVVLLSRADLSERGRLDVTSLGAGIPGFSLSYAAERTLVVPMLGNGDAGIDDTAIAIDLDTTNAREIHRAPPFEIGAVLCPSRMDGKADQPQDPPACFVTDADKGVLLRYPVENGVLGEATSIVVDDVIGLPPRYLGQL